MSDPRPSENQDETPTFPGFRAAGFFDDLPKLTEGFFTDAELAEDEPYDTADAQHIVAALDRLTEQLHLANLIAWQLGTAENYEREIRKGLDR